MPINLSWIFLIFFVQICYTNVFFNLEEIVLTVNSKQSHWKAGYNHYFDGRTIKEIQKIMGVLETSEKIVLPVKDITPLNNLPQSFNSIEAWPRCQSIKQIRDQGSCGSCWAVAAVEVISDRICIISGQTAQTRISAENLIACCGITCGNGCNGGHVSGAWSYYHKNGIVTGWLYNTTNWCQPYSFPPCNHHTQGKYQPCGQTKNVPKCQKECIAGYSNPYKADLHHADLIYTIPNQVEKIQTQIITNGPLEASFIVYTDFLTYKSGIYSHISGTKVGQHAVKIIGWGIDNQIPYWLVANSWNQDWGDHGFFKIKRGTNQCQIESAIYAGIPKFPQVNKQILVNK